MTIASDGLAYLSEHNRVEAENVLRETLTLGLDFKLREKVAGSISYDALYQLICEPLPETGLPIREVLAEVSQKIIPYSTNFASETAMAFPDAGNSVAAISGAILSDLLNQNLINWIPCAPAATLVEMAVLQWVRQLVGFEPPAAKVPTPREIGGFMTSGGVGSNTVAMLVAREHLIPGTMKRGLRDSGRELHVVVPDGIDHYSSRLATGWLGMGERCVIKVPTVNFKYDIPQLKETMSRIVGLGNSRVVVIAYAGDSRTMTCEDFSALRVICNDFAAWLHIDACHGTQLLFSERLKKRITGINLADSITFDPHKVLNVPYVLSMVLFRNPETLEALRRPEDIITGEPHSFGQMTPLLGSRPFSALKLYMLIKNLGRVGLARVIEERHGLAVRLANLIRDDEELLLLNEQININSVAFMYWPRRDRWPKAVDEAAVQRYNTLNSNIQKELFDAGMLWLHNFSLPDSGNVLGLGREVALRPLRYMSGNPNVTIASLKKMLDHVRRTGQALQS